jgi:hypothetical protein
MTATMTAAGMPPREQALPAHGGRVVVGIDDSPSGLAALRWAIGFARSRGARLVAVRAWALGLPRHGGVRHRGGLGHRGGPVGRWFECALGWATGWSSGKTGSARW